MCLYINILNSQKHVIPASKTRLPTGRQVGNRLEEPILASVSRWGDRTSRNDKE